MGFLGGAGAYARIYSSIEFDDIESPDDKFAQAYKARAAENKENAGSKTE